MKEEEKGEKMKRRENLKRREREERQREWVSKAGSFKKWVLSCTLWHNVELSRFIFTV